MGPSDRFEDLKEFTGNGAASGEPLRGEFLQALFDRSQSDRSATVNNTIGQVAKVENIGQVKQLDLPANWVPLEIPANTGGSTFRAFVDKDHPDAKLCFYYRGTRVESKDAQNFNDLLKQPDHKLNSSELQALSPITRDKYDPSDFALYGAATSTINGKRVLEVEGRYPSKQIDTRALYFDADGKGTVQEIYYQGPKAEVGSMAQARKSLKSLQWR